MGASDTTGSSRTPLPSPFDFPEPQTSAEDREQEEKNAILCNIVNEGICFPFKRIAILEEFAERSSTSYLSNFVGPQLDNLPSDMVDTGKSRSGLLAGQSSFSSSRESRTESVEDFDSPLSSKDSGSVHSHKKRFPLRRKKRKSKQSAGWDLFPGITDGDLPASSQATPEFDPTVRLPSFPNHFAPAKLHRVSAPTRHRRSPSDQLAQTFDIQDLEAAENSACMDGVIILEGTDLDEEDQSAATTVQLGPVDSFEGAELNEGRTSSEGGFSVKDTCCLHVHKFKGLVFVNEYAIISTLGRGSFGEVKLALNTSTLEVYALKLISKTRRRNGASRHKTLVAEAAVMSEINVMKELSHPNLVKLVEVIDDPTNNKILMVLEYVEGGSLFAGSQLSPRKRLSELQARKYFRDVLQGLHYLHENKIAHGDLKPDNFLLATNGHIKIADFGSSQLTRVGDLVNRTAGTPAFMAPEMCGGQAYQARLADVWALGVCLYMFVFGRVPFKADSILGLYEQICKAPLDCPSSIFVSDSLKNLLTRLLDKDPETRMCLEDAMRHPWVTENEELPLLPPCPELQAKEMADTEGLLMESWPDEAGEGLLASAMRAVVPINSQSDFPDGAVVVEQGQPAYGLFKVEEGQVEIKTVDDYDTDSDNEEDRERNPATCHELKMLEIMQEACDKASQIASASRVKSGGKVTLTALRSAGLFVGATKDSQNAAGLGMGWQSGVGLAAEWHFTARCKRDAKLKCISYRRFYEVCAKYPEFEADGRAVMAQRRGECKKLDMLELLAAMHPEVKAEVDRMQQLGKT